MNFEPKHGNRPLARMNSALCFEHLITDFSVDKLNDLSLYAYLYKKLHKTEEKQVTRRVLQHTNKRTIEFCTITFHENFTTIRYNRIPHLKDKIIKVLEEGFMKLNFNSNVDNYMKYWFHEVQLLEQWLTKNIEFIDVLEQTNNTNDIVRKVFYSVHLKYIIPEYIASYKSFDDLYNKIKFLNEPFFHWNNRYVDDIEDNILAIIPSLITPLNYPTDIVKFAEECKKWFAVSNNFRLYSSKLLFDKYIIGRCFTKELFTLIKIIFLELSYIPCEIENALGYILLFVKSSNLSVINHYMKEHIVKYKSRQIEEIISLNTHYTNTFTRLKLGICEGFTLIMQDRVVDLCKYIDKLRDHNLILDALECIKYVQNKDVLFKILESDMTLRLLKSPQTSDDIIGKQLNNYKMKSMYYDITNLPTNNLQMLKSSLWDLAIINDIPDWKIPYKLIPFIENFYKNKLVKTNTVITTWLPAYDSITLIINNITINMTSIQATILFLYESNKTFTRNEIIELTGIPDYMLDEIIGTLTNFIIKSGTEYSLIENIRDYSIKDIPLIQKPEKPMREIEVNRIHTIESVIVKIMKKNERMKVDDLKARVVKSITLFLALPELIDTCIKRLIERDYIECDSITNDIIYIT